MTGEEVYQLLMKMSSRADSPRRREKQLKRIADRVGLSSDALRAKARRYAKKSGLDYPLMRRPASENRKAERTQRRETRSAWKTERIAAGKEALAKGADWSELARIFGIKTAEGAAQWWRRNHDGVKTTRRTRRKRR